MHEQLEGAKRNNHVYEKIAKVMQKRHSDKGPSKYALVLRQTGLEDAVTWYTCKDAIMSRDAKRTGLCAVCKRGHNRSSDWFQEPIWNRSMQLGLLNSRGVKHVINCLNFVLILV